MVLKVMSTDRLKRAFQVSRLSGSRNRYRPTMNTVVLLPSAAFLEAISVRHSSHSSLMFSNLS